MVFAHLYVFFGDMSINSSAHFFDCVVFFLILSCRSCLYILEINRLSVASFANIFFSHSVNFLFMLFRASFVVENHLSLIRSHLFILFLLSLLQEADLRI